MVASLAEQQDFLKTQEGVDELSRALSPEDFMMACASSVWT